MRIFFEFWIVLDHYGKQYVLFPFKLTTGLNIINEAANAKLNRSVNFKRTFWCRKIYQKTKEIFVRRSNHKKTRLYIILIRLWALFNIIKCLNLFDLTSFVRLGQKSLQKFVGFSVRFEDTKMFFRN